MLVCSSSPNTQKKNLTAWEMYLVLNMSLRSTSSYAQKSTTSVQCLVVLFLNQAKTHSPPEMFFFTVRRDKVSPLWRSLDTSVTSYSQQCYRYMKGLSYIISNILLATVLPLPFSFYAPAFISWPWFDTKGTVFKTNSILLMLDQTVSRHHPQIPIPSPSLHTSECDLVWKDF